MKNFKNKIELGILILSVFVLIPSVSYAIWSMTLQQESTNIVNTACFKINFKDQNEIHLQSAYPISDAEGMNLIPYTFTIENICNTNATYQINLEELTTELKKLSKEYVKLSLNNSKAKLLNTYETVEKTLSNAESSKKLTTGVLKAGDSKTFELRLWLDENTPTISDAMNATFQSKITIIAVQKEGLPEVDIAAVDNLNEIKVDISTIENPKNETLTYFYQLNEEAEIESEENTHTFTELSDGKYKARGRAETLDGVILEEKELDVTVAYETVYVSSTGNDATGNGSLENPFGTLQPAYNKVKSGGEILLLSDLTATSTTNMNIENKEVTLKSNGENVYTILKDSSFTTQILDITNSNTVTTSNITFDGNDVQSSAALIVSYNATVNVDEGTTIMRGNNYGRYYEGHDANVSWGGGIESNNSILNINGGIIKQNNIYNDINNAQGAGIFGYSSTINFYSGIISYNIAISTNGSQGGGICTWGSTINMYYGMVSNNEAAHGGGIFVCDSEMFLSSGIVSQNTATISGGGIISWGYLKPQTIVHIKGGNISNNTSPTGADTYEIYGGQIIDER